MSLFSYQNKPSLFHWVACVIYEALVSQPQRFKAKLSRKPIECYKMWELSFLRKATKGLKNRIESEPEPNKAKMQTMASLPKIP